MTMVKDENLIMLNQIKLLTDEINELKKPIKKKEWEKNCNCKPCGCNEVFKVYCQNHYKLELRLVVKAKP